MECRSRHQLSYQQAQDIADRRPPAAGFAPGQVAELQQMLDLLVHVTDVWRARRLEVCTISRFSKAVYAASKLGVHSIDIWHAARLDHETLHMRGKFSAAGVWHMAPF